MRVVLRVAYVLVPVLAWAVALPIVFGELPYEIKSGQLRPEFWLIGATAMLGALAAPGYLWALFYSSVPPNSPPFFTKWVSASLAAGIVAGLVGGVFAVMAFWPIALLHTLSVAMCIHLWVRWAREVSASPPNV